MTESFAAGACGITKGSTVRVVNTGTLQLRVRDCPGTTCRIQTKRRVDGDRGVVESGPEYPATGLIWWRIRWEDGQEGWSAEVGSGPCLLEVETAERPGPFSLSINAECDGSSPQIRLNWTSSAGATGYDVYRNDTLYRSNITGNQFLNTAVTAGKTYSYSVRAKNSAGTRDTSIDSASAPASCGMTEPGDFSFTLTPECDGSSPRIRLNWTSSAGATSYEVYRNGSLYQSDVAGTQFLNTSVTAGNSYTYSVRAKNSAGTRDTSPLSASAPSQCNGGMSRINGSVSRSGRSTPVFLQRYPAGTSSIINPDLRTWLLVHGRINTSATPWVVGLARAIKDLYPIDQILLLDWREAADAPDISSNEEDWIEPVADWAADTLKSSGFAGSVLNIIGHSWGGNMAAEIAERIPYIRGRTTALVNTIVALDPAKNGTGSFNPDDSNADSGIREIDFARNSRFSWAFHSSWFGSAETPQTAHEAFAVFTDPFNPLKAHGLVIDIFTYLITHTDQASPRFSLSRLLDESSASRKLGPWRPDSARAKFEGEVKESAGYEAGINSDPTGRIPVSFTYLSDSTGIEVTEFVSSGPEIIVRGNGITIVNHDLTPALAEGTDFGNVDVASGSVIHTFVIENSGAGLLSLPGLLRVQITGSGDFTVFTQPLSPIAANGGTATFQIRFDPSAKGLRTATVTIPNDDTDENPYNFTIQGAGISEPATVSRPTILPEGGTFSARVVVTLTCTTPEALIYYTTNGIDPTTTSTSYEGPFILSSSADLRVRAFKNGYNPSPIASGIFTVTPQDTSPPSLIITDPSDSTTVARSTLLVSGTASDTGRGNNGVTSVTVNGVIADSGTASGGSTAHWSARITLNPGANTIKVVAQDDLKNSSLQQITVTYNPPETIGPALTIVFPANNATVSTANLTVTGTASDTGAGNNGVSSVTVNGLVANNGIATGPNVANWSAITTLKPGANTITVSAVDNLNNRTDKQITVRYENPRPIISLSGDLSFGDVKIGSVGQRTLRIANVGDSTLTVNSIVLPPGFTGTLASRTIDRGGSQDVVVTFAPTAAIDYTGTLAVNSDGTGEKTRAISGRGTDGHTPAARFIGTDLVTQGNWRNRYGSDGFIIVGDYVKPPLSYLVYDRRGKSDFSWPWAVDQSGALERSNGVGRAASAWYSKTEFDVILTFIDQAKHRVAFYVVDFDGDQRAQTIEIWDAAGRKLLDSRTVAGFHGGQYLIWDFSTSVIVRFKNLRPESANAVLSGIFFDPPSSFGIFVAEHEQTGGDWVGKFGSIGYYLAQGPPKNFPSGINALIWNADENLWWPPKREKRELAVPNSSDRLAACWYAADHFFVDVDVGQNRPHRVALYFLDWDNSPRDQAIEVSDSNGKLIDRRSVKRFGNGRYLVWDVWGKVRFRVQSENQANAVLSAIFLDLPPTAKFEREDSTTQGDWIGRYGREGFGIDAADTSKAFHHGSVLIAAEGLPSVWDHATEDRRVLERANNEKRLAAAWYGGLRVRAEARITDNQPHVFSVYCLDWDRTGRSQRIEARDWLNQRVLDRRYVSGFAEGRYLSWTVEGSVFLWAERLTGANAVISGYFIDPPGALPGAPLLNPLALTRQSVGQTPELHISHQNEIHLLLTAAAGSSVVLEASTDLVNWTPVTTNAVSEAGVLDVVPHPNSDATRRFFRLITSEKNH